MARITIQYPPDFDGELHIETAFVKEYSSGRKAHQFTFTVASKKADAWEALVDVANDILAQDQRIKSRR